MSGGLTIERPIVDQRARWPVDWFKRILFTWWIGRGHRSDTFFTFITGLNFGWSKPAMLCLLVNDALTYDKKWKFIPFDLCYMIKFSRPQFQKGFRIGQLDFDQIHLMKYFWRSHFSLVSVSNHETSSTFFERNIRRFSWAVVDIKSIFDKLKVNESSFRVVDKRRTELVIR